MRENKGITMVALVITIMILLVLAGITLRFGQNTIRAANLENLKTNMLLIKAKAKEDVEMANFHYKDEVTRDVTDYLKGVIIPNEELGNYIEGLSNNEDTVVYTKLYENYLNDDLGLKNIKSNDKDGYYLIKYDIQNVLVEIYNTRGFKDSNDEIKYSLTDIEQIDL